MILDQFWLTDAQFSKIAPHLPTDTRGKARVDDRRVISGIVHVLNRAGAGSTRRRNTVRKKRSTIAMSAGRPRASGATVSRARSSRRPAGGGSHRLLGGEGAPLGQRRRRGEKNQAIGRSRGGRTTKIHALTDANCRPIAFMLTGGNVADCVAGAELSPSFRRVKSCTATRVTTAMRSGGKSRARRDAEHPAKGQPKMEELLLPFLYRNRNAIERMFCRLKDFRRLATRYDRNAANFLAAVCIAATVSYWL